MNMKIAERSRQQAVLVLDIASAMPDNLLTGDHNIELVVDVYEIAAELGFCGRVANIAGDTFNTIPLYTKTCHSGSAWITWREQYALAAELLLEGWCPGDQVPGTSVDEHGIRVLDR